MTDSKNTLKWIHAALCIGAIFVFLVLPLTFFIHYGDHRYDNSTGAAEFLNLLHPRRLISNTKRLVLMLSFVGMPIIALLTNLARNGILRIIASFAMFVPTLVFLGNYLESDEVGLGLIGYCLCTLGCVVLGFVINRCRDTDKQQQQPYPKLKMPK